MTDRRRLLRARFDLWQSIAPRREAPSAAVRRIRALPLEHAKALRDRCDAGEGWRSRLYIDIYAAALGRPASVDDILCAGYHPKAIAEQMNTPSPFLYRHAREPLTGKRILVPISWKKGTAPPPGTSDCPGYMGRGRIKL